MFFAFLLYSRTLQNFSKPIYNVETSFTSYLYNDLLWQALSVLKQFHSNSFLALLQRWRRRWFVLRHSGELPGQYFLYYYTDRSCRKLKGQIDLDECEQVCASFFSLTCWFSLQSCYGGTTTFLITLIIILSSSQFLVMHFKYFFNLGRHWSSIWK